MPDMPTILIIDDDDAMRSVINRTLSRSGYSTLEASNGKEGMQRIAQSSVDLVITDIIMPEMEGIDLIGKLIKMNPRPKIVAISGGGRVSENYYLELAQKFGADKILPKPFEIAELVATVEALLAE